MAGTAASARLHGAGGARARRAHAEAKGPFLSLGTIAWGLSISFLFGNIDGLGNFNGISQIPPITLGPVGLGGAGSLFGAVIGAVVVTLLKNAVQDWFPLIFPGISGRLQIVPFRRCSFSVPAMG